MDLVALLPIRIDPSLPTPATLQSLALRFQLTSTDAAYDELAGAAWAAGVGVLAA
ncbi:MAG: hypothetical protein RLZZ609_1001 [Cyanobacteriota bacterium]